MNKEEIRKIIISELKQTWTHSAEVIADRILAKLPDDFEVIARGIIAGINNGSYYDIQIGGKSILTIFPQKYQGKQIEIGIRVIK